MSRLQLGVGNTFFGLCMLRLCTFGGCFLERDGRRLDAVSSQRKALALLALLAESGDRGVTRESAMAMLWPESDEDRARATLRQLMKALRDQLGDPDLFASTSELRLERQVVGADVLEFRAAIAAGHDERAVELYAGPWMAGFHAKASNAFEQWVDATRDALLADVLGALERLARRAQAEHRHSDAARLWRRIAALQPLSDRVAIELIRSLELGGDRTAALRHAAVYEALVREETGAALPTSIAEFVSQAEGEPVRAANRDALVAADAPAPLPAEHVRAPASASASRVRLVAAGIAVATLAVVARVLWPTGAERASASAPPVSRAEMATVVSSVAVLPFASIPTTPDSVTGDPFTDGLTDLVIGTLGRIPGLKVTGRTSAFALRRTSFDAQQIGSALGVAALLEGTVARSNDRLRVVVQLIGTRDGFVIWSETYERPLTDLFALQDEIARAVASALRLQLGPAPPAARPTADSAAWSLYLRGRHVFHTQFGPEGVSRSIELLREATARDSQFALAFAALSDAYTRLAIFGFAPPRPAYAAARQAAEHALTVDSALADAHVALAHVRCVADYEWDGAIAQFEHAARLDPGNSFARAPHAICLASQGRFEEALALLVEAHSRDPLSTAVPNVRGRVLVSSGQPEQAILLLRQALELNPLMDVAYQQLGHAYLAVSRPADAIRAFREAAAISGARDSAHLAYGFAVSGAPDSARAILEAIRNAPGAAMQLPVHLAMVYAALGERDAAFGWLDRGFAQRASFMVGIKSEPALASLHSDPRWRALLHRMRLTP